MKKKFDPNLREAMDEIRAICKKRNIAAHVLLAAEDFYEFGLLFDIPSWSVISFEPQPGNDTGLRIKASSSNPGDHEKMEATVGMIWTFDDMLMNSLVVTDHLKKAIQEKMTVLHLNRVGTAPDSVPEKTSTSKTIYFDDHVKLDWYEKDTINFHRLDKVLKTITLGANGESGTLTVDRERSVEGRLVAKGNYEHHPCTLELDSISLSKGRIFYGNQTSLVTIT